MANKLLYTYSRSTDTGAEAIPAEKLTTYHDSLIFDTDRKSIWAVGAEFGYATHMNQGSASNAEYGVITSIGTAADGTVSYTYDDLTGDGAGDFLISFTQNKNGKVNMTTGSFSNAASKSTAASYVSYVYIDATGKLSYTYADINHTTNGGEEQSAVAISGTDTVNALTGIAISKSGVISYSYAPVHSTFTSLSTATNARTNKQYIINSTLSYGDGAYTITNTYAAHVINPAVTGNVDVDSVNVFSQDISQDDSTGALTFERTSYELTTKHYVDRLVQANDAMRYCGTVAPSTPDSAITFTYTAPAGLSYTSTWAFSRGALYKVSASGYIGMAYVHSGDMVICNTDAATITDPAQNSFKSSTFADWDIINENLNLTTTKSPAQGNAVTTVTITNSNALNVITGVNLDASGALTYHYQAVNTTHSTNEGTKENPMTSYIAGVSISEDGTISYTYGTVYHECVTETQTAAPYVTNSVNITAEGELSYTNVDIAKADYHYAVAGVSSDNSGDFITRITNDAKGHTTVITTGSFSNANTGTTGADGVLTNANIDATGKLSYVITNIAVSSGTDSIETGDGATELSETSTEGHRFISSISQAANGKIAYTYADIYTPALSLEETVSGDFVMATTVSDHKITHTYGTFGYNEDQNINAPYVTRSVSISATGQITYTNTAINTADYHYAPEGAQSYAITCEGEMEAITKITTDAKGHIVAVERGPIDGHHGGSFGSSTETQTIGTTSATTATFVTSASLSADGTLTGTTGTISHATSGVTAGSHGPNANAMLGFRSTFSVPYFAVNDCGHITAATTYTITMPSQSHHGGSVTAPNGNYVTSVSLNATGTLSGTYEAFSSITAGAASKLVDTVDVGSASLPVYFVDGLPEPITSLNLGSGNITAATFNGNLNGNATTASTATKLGTANVGDAMTPIYLNAGTPTASTYTIKTSVPADAVFTDTHYTNTLTLSVDGNNGSTVFNQSANQTFTVPKAGNTTYGTVTINEVKATKVNNAVAADSATTATKLSTESAGDANTPIYFANGVPVSTGKTIGNAADNIPLSNGSINTNLNADMVDFCHVTINGSMATTAQTINFVI